MSTSSSSSRIASTSSTMMMNPSPSDPPAQAQLLSTDTPSSLSSSLATASSLLHSHLPVAFPTETVYGLGASALSSTAVQRIFSAKGRPSDNPLIVHVSSRQMLEQLLPRSRSRSSGGGGGGKSDDDDGDKKEDKGKGKVIGINEMYEKLMDKFWPGPLSLVFNLSPSTSNEPPLMRVAPEVTANQPSICIRMPRHRLALELIETCQVPLAAPSANLSSRPSPTCARHVLDDLGTGRGVGAVLDGGECTVGVESTVVDYVEEEEGRGGGGGYLRILRAGGVSVEDIEECLNQAGFETRSKQTGGGGGGQGIVQVYSRDFKSHSLESNPTTPGMKYKHYSPGNSKVVLVRGVRGNKFLPSLQELVQLSCLTQQVEGRAYRVGLMLTEQTLEEIGSTTLNETERGGGGGPKQLKLGAPPPSLFAQLTDNEESNLPELDTIELWSLPLAGEGGNVGQDAARRLFSGLRYFDSMPSSEEEEEERDKRVGVDMILIECVEEKGVGLAVMERARKAAGGIERGGEMEFAL